MSEALYVYLLPKFTHSLQPQTIDLLIIRMALFDLSNNPSDIERPFPELLVLARGQEWNNLRIGWKTW